VNILSTPHILTTDNEEAEIVVGSNVPFPSGIVGGGFPGGAGSQAAQLGSFFPSVSVQRQDVALTLKITPRINAANFVTLEVEQTIEEIEGIDQQLGPTTSKRSVKTTVVVKDQHTVVIGGLQKNRQINNSHKVPFLGEVPVLGYFFRDSTKARERRNLLLLLTPHVVEGPEDFRAIFLRKLEEHREFVSRFHKEGNNLVVGIDYAKKHGVLEAIHKSIAAAREDEELLERIRQQNEGPPLPQDVDGVPYDGDGSEEGGETGGQGATDPPAKPERAAYLPAPEDGVDGNQPVPLRPPPPPDFEVPPAPEPGPAH